MATPSPKSVSGGTGNAQGACQLAPLSEEEFLEAAFSRQMVRSAFRVIQARILGGRTPTIRWPRAAWIGLALTQLRVPGLLYSKPEVSDMPSPRGSRGIRMGSRRRRNVSPGFDVVPTEVRRHFNRLVALIEGELNAQVRAGWLRKPNGKGVALSLRARNEALPAGSSGGNSHCAEEVGKVSGTPPHQALGAQPPVPASAGAAPVIKAEVGADDDGCVAVSAKGADGSTVSTRLKSPKGCVLIGNSKGRRTHRFGVRLLAAASGRAVTLHDKDFAKLNTILRDASALFRCRKGSSKNPKKIPVNWVAVESDARVRLVPRP
jgi:hypothetical protein